MLRINSTITKYMVLTIIVLPTPFPCLSGGIKGDAELLKTVALMHKANFESILTWKSEAFEERRSTQGDTYEYMLKSKCTLAYDQLKNASRWNREPQEHHTEKNGVIFDAGNTTYNSAMIKDQTSYTYRCSGTDAKGNDAYRVIIAGAERMSRQPTNECLDPRYFYNDAGNNHIYSRLMFLYENANNPKLTERHVKREGDHVIMTLEKTDEGGTRTERYVFDLSAGGNVVEFYNSGPTYENHRKYEYEKKSGVWVLKSYKKWNTTHHKDNKEPLRSTRTITWSNSVVNVPFEEDEFTLAKMGVRTGDDIQDERLGMMYKYGGEDMLDILDTVDISQVAVDTKSDGVGEEANEVVTVTQNEDSNDVDTVAEKEILQTSEATHDNKGTRRYIYFIIIASVIGLVGVMYKLTHRFLKESDRC